MEEFNVLEKIIYKKNALEDLSNYLKKFKKTLIITSITPKTLFLNVFCNYLNEKQINFEILTIKNNVCNYSNLLLCGSYVLNADCIVAFGSGSIFDLTKLVATKFNLPHIVCPTAITHFGMFSNVCYHKNTLKTEKLVCNFPEKVFIDEGLILKSPERFINSAFAFIFSFYELYLNEYVKNLLFSCENYEFLNKLQEILKKTEGLINYVEINKTLTLLNLMDNMIELFQLAGNKNLCFVDFATENYSSKKNFGKECLLSATILLQVYKNFWNGNLCYQNIPNIEKCLNLLNKKGQSEFEFFSFCEKYQKVTSERFIYKAKSIKTNVQNMLETIITKLSKICHKLTNLNLQETKIVCYDEIVNNLTITAINSNNFQLATILRLGFL